MDRHRLLFKCGHTRFSRAERRVLSHLGRVAPLHWLDQAMGTKGEQGVGTFSAMSGGAVRRHRSKRVAWTAAIAAGVATLSVCAVPAAGGTARSATAARQPDMQVVEAAPAGGVLAGATRLGEMSPATALSGAIALRPRDEAALASFIADASDPSSPSFGDYLAKGQFATSYGPTRAAIGAVESFLGRSGLTMSGVSGDELLVRFSGRAAAVEVAFGTKIERYRLADGSLGYGTTSAVKLPAAIAPAVAGVVGLDDLVHLRTRPLHGTGLHRVAAAPTASATGGPHACAGAISQEQYGAVTDDQVAHSYGVDGLYAAGDIGRGQTVDIFELEPFSMGDISAFDKCYFATSHTSQVRAFTIDGGAGAGEGSGEAALDVENVSALAPGADINVYEAPNTAIGSLDNYDAMVVADNARAISTSWGLCETAFQMGAPGTQEIESSIFMEAAAQGESIFAAAGDDGSDDCSPGPAKLPQFLSVDDPGSDPYVVSVGGTTFLSTAEPPSESVWNDGGSGGAGGGGISASWAMPAWQQDGGAPGVANNFYMSKSVYEFCSNDPGGTANDAHPAGFPTTLASGTLCREVPDVTALADEYTAITVYFAGWTAFGGTSSSAPLWAAMDAEMSASSYCSGATHGVGFISPLLYHVAANTTTYKQGFNDIAVGNNDNFGVGLDLPGGATTYQSAAGYDMASGLGSPRITNPGGAPGLAALVCKAAKSPTRAVVTGILPNSGPAAGGTAITITGSNFGHATGSVQFGTIRVPASAITSWSCPAGKPCTITLSTPLYHKPPGTGGPSGGEAVVTVIPASGTYVANLPSQKSLFHYLANSPSGAPVVEYVSPAAGLSTGGTKITVVGSGFATGGTPTVSVGGTAATSVHVLSDAELTAVTPAAPSNGCAAGSGLVATGACQVEVTVTNAAGASPLQTIEPAYEGSITIGPNGVFVPPAGCSCETVPAMTEFDYAPRPQITSVNPPYGNALGGTVETIGGSGFNFLTYAWTDFGTPSSADSQDYNIVGISAHSVRVVEFGAPNPPGNAPQPAAVSVQSFGGLGSNSATSKFAYAGIPDVTGLSSKYGSTQGGQPLTIYGSGLEDASSIQFNSWQAPFVPPAVVYRSSPPVSDTSMKISTPSNVPTDSYVNVCSASGCSKNTLKATYIFDYPGQPVVSSDSPKSGPGHGGTHITIKGSLLTGVRAVYFGNAPSPAFSNGASVQPTGDSTVITATAPPGIPGSTVDVRVLTYGSSSLSNINKNVTFTYTKGTPSAPGPLVVRALPGTATVEWQVPLTSGGYPLESYTLTATSPGRPSIVVKDLSIVTLKYQFPFLQPGVPWTFAVVALNKAGGGVSATAPPVTLPAGGNGYLVATANGSVFGFGSLASDGGAEQLASIVGIAGEPDGLGYLELSSTGAVYHFGDAGYFGSATLRGGKAVAIALAPGGKGYWVVSNTGAVYAFGSARYKGGLTKVTNVSGIAPTRDGNGYWIAQANGGVHAFGDAVLHGSMKGKHLNKPIVGVVADPVGGGYWLIGGDGGVFAFAAPYYGSMIGKHLNEGATGMVPTPDGGGYWIVAADGGVFTFGKASYEGNALSFVKSAAIGIASGL